MSFFDRVKNLFSSKPTVSSPDEEAIVLNTPQVPISQEVITVPTSEVQPFSPEMDIIPFWLENEDALRDEGVIFGLSESKAEEKIGAIRNYFAHQTAELEKTVEYHSEKIGEINLLIEQKETRINELTEKARVLENRERTDHQLPRTFIGIVLSLAMCIGNYYLIDESILTNFPQNHYVIALGIFLAGMFNLFNPKSLFHEKDSSISWRQLLEEVGMPLAASVFVFVQSLDNQSFLRSFALFFFVFFLFLFAGKLLLSNLTVLKTDSGIWFDNLRLQKDKINKVQEWEDEITKLKLEIDEQRVEKWKIVDALKLPEAELKRLNERREMLVKLFESEFNLARSYREKLTGKQIQDILK
ncbi:hypothetical protein GCM10011514_15410 [Emticicia aquatilis]|uniref:Uncharacterized protein n=1 Tax=Emticicia aquatilis TaxID=1537369 RepID=A0A916YLS4_9BACT|nr:hypothetical protein [Emticicia aquatilis]GGD52075.1 hypothetical protein GCM10011514_15410 [Emticicia aquatilis]